MAWEVTQIQLATPSGGAGAVEKRHDDVLVALRRIMRATDLYSKRLSKTAGLTSPQLMLLQAIRERGDVTIGTIARHVSLSQATVTTILDRLEARGLVYRERSTVDKRKVHAHLTDDGCSVLDGAPTPLQLSFTQRFERLESWEQNMITASLQRVADMMDAGELDASPFLHVGLIDRYYEDTAPQTDAAQPPGIDGSSHRASNDG